MTWLIVESLFCLVSAGGEKKIDVAYRFVTQPLPSGKIPATMQQLGRMPVGSDTSGLGIFPDSFVTTQFNAIWIRCRCTPPTERQQ